MKSLLKYENNWEYDSYSVNRKPIADLKKVEIDGVLYNVRAADISIPYNDMGQSYNATSKHFFITVKTPIGNKSFDLNEVVGKKKVYAIKYKLEKND